VIGFETTELEALYTVYSRFLFGLSLSAPVCLSVVLFGENHVAPSLSWLCFFRILESPIVLVGMGISPFAARFDRAKRLTSYALLVEGLPLGLLVAYFTGAESVRRRAKTGSWPTPVRGRNVQFDHLGISGGRIRANNRGVVFHP
jgi:hypothetical protein